MSGAKGKRTHLHVSEALSEKLARTSTERVVDTLHVSEALSEELKWTGGEPVVDSDIKRWLS